MTEPEAPAPKVGAKPPKRKPFKKPPEEVAAPPVVNEAALKERRRIVRSIPVPDVNESDTDSDWAKFK